MQASSFVPRLAGSSGFLQLPSRLLCGLLEYFFPAFYSSLLRVGATRRQKGRNREMLGGIPWKAFQGGSEELLWCCRLVRNPPLKVGIGRGFTRFVSVGIFQRAWKGWAVLITPATAGSIPWLPEALIQDCSASFGCCHSAQPLQFLMEASPALFHACLLEASWCSQECIGFSNRTLFSRCTQ